MLLRRTILASAGLLAARGIAAQPGPATLTLLLADDPGAAVPGTGDVNADLIGSKMFQGLLRFSPALQPLPELARAWSVSSDGRTTIFKLQPGVTWHDGRPFTAEDVLFSVMERTAQLPATAQAMIGRIKAAATSGPETVLFTLDAPFQPFLLLFDVTQCPIVPAHLFRGSSGAPVGTGPFQWTERRPGQPVRLTRNAAYWRPGLPTPAAIEGVVLTDPSARLEAVAAGGARVTSGDGLAPDALAQMRDRPGLQLGPGGWAYAAPMVSLVLNHRIRPLDDARVRQAISLALDRAYILRRVWSGFGQVATGPIAQASAFYDRSLPIPSNDPRQAAALLGEAGLRPNGQGIRLTLRHMLRAQDGPGLALASYLQGALRQVGIALVLETGDTEARLAARDFDCVTVMQEQAGDPSIGLAPAYVSGSPANLAGYASAAADELWDRADRAEEHATRQAAFADLQRLLIKDAVHIWLVEPQIPAVMGRSVQPGAALATGLRGSFDDWVVRQG